MVLVKLKSDSARLVTNISFPREEVSYVNATDLTDTVNYAWAVADSSIYEQKVYEFADKNVRDPNDVTLLQTIRFEYPIIAGRKVVVSRQV